MVSPYSAKSYRAVLLRLSIAFVGAIIAGFYGMVHNLIVYPISWEFFDEMSFRYSHFDFGLSKRALAAETGFFGCGLAGFLVTWLFARVTVTSWSPREAFWRSLLGLGIVAAFAALGSVAGYQYSRMYNMSQYWAEFFQSIVIQDTEGFVHVSYIHSGGFQGALLGTLVAIVVLINQARPTGESA